MSQNAAEGNAAFVIWSNECLDWDNWSEAFEEDYSNLTEEEKYRLMEELVAGGKSIIMVSSELPEVIGMSDRVVVMREGKIMGVLNHDELNEEVIMSFAMGG